MVKGKSFDTSKTRRIRKIEMLNHIKRKRARTEDEKEGEENLSRVASSTVTGL